MDANTADDPDAIHFDLCHAILMIARSLDFVGIDDTCHGHRVGYIAYECAKLLDWPKEDQDFAFFAGLIHDCGVSSSAEHKRLLGGLKPEGTEGHCIRGRDALAESVVMRPFADPVYYHHTRWEDLEPLDIDDTVKRFGALVHLSDRVDFLRARYITDLHPDFVVLHEDLIAENILQHAGTMFRPDFAEAMARLVTVDGFWFTMDQGYIEQLALEIGAGGKYHVPLDVAEAINLAKIMGRIVDAKSPFTHEHSERVALISRELAVDLGFDDTTCQKIHIAGLLHDLGKLRVDDAVLHKPGALTREEYAAIRRHVVDTGLALQGCFPGEMIPRWAANHHEKLDGSGYPYRLHDEQIDMPSRIIAVADIFQALAQNRPYRGRLSFDKIMEIVDPMVDTHKLDRDVVAVVHRRAADYYALATE